MSRSVCGVTFSTEVSILASLTTLRNAFLTDRQPLHHLVQHGALAVGKCCETLGEAFAIAGGLPGLSDEPQRLVDAVEQLLLAIWLLNKVDGAGFNGLDGDGDVSVSAENTIGMRAPIAFNSSWSAGPLVCAIPTSSTRQPGCSALKLSRNYCAERNVAACRPTEVTNSAIESSTVSSSSMMNTVGSGMWQFPGLATGSVNWNTQPPPAFPN